MDIKKDVTLLIRNQIKLNRIKVRKNKIYKDKVYKYQDMITLKKVFCELDDYYSKNIEADDLIKRLSHLDFLLNYANSILSSIPMVLALGGVAGALNEACGLLKFTKTSTLLEVGLRVICFMTFVFLAVLFTLKAFNISEGFVISNKFLFAFKYEKKLVLKKLKNEFKLDLYMK